MTLFDDFFDRKTDRFSKPAIEHAAAHPYKLSMVKDCINTLAQQQSTSLNRNCRFYINHQQISPFEAKKLMQQASAASHFDAIDWQMLCGGKAFLIFINHAALFSKRLAQESQKFLGNFATRFEPEGITIEHHIIIGQYSETPFGVHVDDANDRVFHFNLGPAEKEMILWPREAYLNTYPDASAQPLNTVSLKGSQRYPMPVDSCFFLPANYFHVGRSIAGTSAVVSLALSRITQELQLKAVMRELRNAVAITENTEPYWQHFAEAPEKAATTALENAFDHCRYAELLKQAQARRLSNRSVVETQTLRPPKLPVGLCQLNLSTNTPLQVLKEPHQLHLYAQGHHIKVSDASTIDALMHVLNRKSIKIESHQIYQGIRQRDPLALALAWLLATGSAVCCNLTKEVVVT